MTLGVAWYPEQWPAERWGEDLAHMRRLGIRVARVGEFAWSRLEPAPQDFRTEWLVAVCDLAERHGIGVLLGTPTAAPPKWLVDRHPSVLQTDRSGRARPFGSRRSYSFSSPIYRKYCARIVREVAGTVGEHPAVVGWQIDNELGCHDTTRCYGDDAAQAFRLWLEARYDTVEALNAAWGTVFWSHEYRDFSEVDPPRESQTFGNPAHELDFRRCSSDQVGSFVAEQAGILRALSPGRPIGTNLMMCAGEFDERKVAAELDVVQWDAYPVALMGFATDAESVAAVGRTGDPDLFTFSLDLFRGLKGRATWGVELQTGNVNWSRRNLLPAPGALRLWAHAATAHGADLVGWFRWRALPYGPEQWHAGLLRHDASEDRGAAELPRLAEELAVRRPGPAKPPGAPAPVAPSQVAILHDYEDLWALQLGPHGPYDYWRHLLGEYTALRSLGHMLDVVHPNADLSRYRLLAAPALHLVDEALAGRLAAYVEAGGVLVLGSRAGQKDRNSRHVPAAPGPLRPLAGAVARNWESGHPALAHSVRHAGAEHAVHMWVTSLEPTEPGTEVEAEFTGGLFAGRPAVTRRRAGAGTVFWSGLCAGPALTASVYAAALDAAGLPAQPLERWERRSERDGLQYRFDWAKAEVDLSWPLP